MALPLTLALPLASIDDCDDTDALPNLTLSTEIETVAELLTVAEPPKVAVALDVVVAVVETVALPPLITEPLAVVFTEVVDVPLTRAEPSGTLLALQVIDDVEPELALAF